jgi:hypothetical protein
MPNRQSTLELGVKEPKKVFLFGFRVDFFLGKAFSALLPFYSLTLTTFPIIFFKLVSQYKEPNIKIGL